MTVSSPSPNSNIPTHIAIIMDGNGRWARTRKLPRKAGHKQGAEAARKIVKAAVEMGVQYLTLFGFSSENWSRPKSEIDDLMKLLRHYLRSETAEFHKNGARLSVIGNRSAFDADIIELIENAETLTKDNDKITVVIALNYGGRADILHAVKATLENGEPADAFEQNLMTAGIPDPDLLIRTSGEMRISNFLLWQCAYTELYFSDVLWPDFSADDLADAITNYQSRERRFGGLGQESSAQEGV